MVMKILVVGGGGREHAITRALARNSQVAVHAVMGRLNPGIVDLAAAVKQIRETDVEAVVRYAREQGIDGAVIGPEAPLEAGIVDQLNEAGIPAVGPTRTAARIETDKAFCRDLMEEHRIPGRPGYRVFHNTAEACRFVRDYPGDLVVKPIGLTGGKGVRVMGEQVDQEGALAYVRELAGEVVIEERLLGEEFTLMAFVDGTHLVPMPLVQDHKRALEGDLGLNTGGMGSYSMPNHRLPFVTEQDFATALSIMEQVVGAMAGEGIPYKGILYGQFMATATGPMVVEFNARFGDPEAMNVLSLLESDLSEVVFAIADGTLNRMQVSFQEKATVCKYLVPEGYPAAPKAGAPLTIGAYGDARLFYANVDQQDGHLCTASSRTLAFVGVGETLTEAEGIAEQAASAVKGPVYHRRDIGTDGLLARRCAHMRDIR
ncbi:phosphoribosylamine--glycine ligase [Methanosphaerula palustris]|uniref:Phosphoribosylamine--glycine ligase n=1 Tax=Methanosphaerula palustris (strain ATCC BAA-1556 / DSM 19958 / E1-9c) TaxID=521011 RepID=B8GEE0_METPE|nr:phosphoribosylamine--glycine ligase [Methanosphaerula palustris]ACL17641.1 phosphoribosylamine/glycine ligase [Methanosphaerula palustris E1-9c]